MPPSAREFLEGYGVLGSPFYHTYVLSSSPQDAWGCHGGTTGGGYLCGGVAHLSLARCIDGGDEAGIIYLVTGVCHQIANRILAAAATQIPEASDPQVRGSYLTFKRYGRDYSWIPAGKKWSDRWYHCTANLAHSAALGRSKPVQTSGILSSMTQSAHDMNRLESRSELSSLIQTGLGHGVDDDKLDALTTMREHLEHKIDHLAGLLMRHEIRPSRYLELLDEALIEASGVGEEILGPQNFHKVFGELRVNRLGDARQFIEQFSKAH